VRALVLPIGLSVIFVYAVVAVLGWWRPVFVDERPVQRWVWVVLITFGVVILAGTDYGALTDKGAGFVIALLLGGLLVGFAEEGMFRGVGVTVFRANGYPEAKVALWSSVVFGAVHLTNAISTGGAAVGQAIAVSFAGYFLYLTRRVSGGLLVPAVIHGLFDFSITSGARHRRLRIHRRHRTDPSLRRSRHRSAEAPPLHRTRCQDVRGVLSVEARAAKLSQRTSALDGTRIRAAG
jgi:membrane protease YdiL (CAAX protease family)